MGCYERIVLVQKDKEPRPPLPDNQVVCTKACYTVVAKVDAIDTRGTWCVDGLAGPQDLFGLVVSTWTVRKVCRQEQRRSEKDDGCRGHS